MIKIFMICPCTYLLHYSHLIDYVGSLPLAILGIVVQFFGCGGNTLRPLSSSLDNTIEKHRRRMLLAVESFVCHSYELSIDHMVHILHSGLEFRACAYKVLDVRGTELGLRLLLVRKLEPLIHQCKIQVLYLTCVYLADGYNELRSLDVVPALVVLEDVHELPRHGPAPMRRVNDPLHHIMFYHRYPHPKIADLHVAFVYRCEASLRTILSTLFITDISECLSTMGTVYNGLLAGVILGIQQLLLVLPYHTKNKSTEFCGRHSMLLQLIDAPKCKCV